VPRSRGLLAFRDYLTSYTQSPEFTQLLADTQKLKGGLSGIRYCLHIDAGRITVSRYESEPDYSAEVLRTFEKFQQGAAKEYRFEFSSWPDMNHVEAAILERVARLYPDVFSALDQYGVQHRTYLDQTIVTFDREVQFYVACLQHSGKRPSPAPLDSSIT
jgi:DNA mismatch repair protein MutS